MNTRDMERRGSRFRNWEGRRLGTTRGQALSKYGNPVLDPTDQAVHDRGRLRPERRQRLSRCVNRVLDPTDQAVHVSVEIRVGADNETIAEGQAPQALRQFVGPRDRRIADQHGNHQDLATQGGLDLDPDEVARIVEPTGSALPDHRKPSVANDGEQDITGGNPFG
jgi:hypothetical protein